MNRRDFLTAIIVAPSAVACIPAPKQEITYALLTKVYNECLVGSIITTGASHNITTGASHNIVGIALENIPKGKYGWVLPL